MEVMIWGLVTHLQVFEAQLCLGVKGLRVLVNLGNLVICLDNLHRQTANTAVTAS